MEATPEIIVRSVRRGYIRGVRRGYIRGRGFASERKFLLDLNLRNFFLFLRKGGLWIRGIPSSITNLLNGSQPTPAVTKTTTTMINNNNNMSNKHIKNIATKLTKLTSLY